MKAINIDLDTYAVTFLDLKPCIRTYKEVTYSSWKRLNQVVSKGLTNGTMSYQKIRSNVVIKEKE